MQVMKKISNWTFGSVFRTLGRIIAYLIIGIILAIICSKTKIKLPKILGIETIKAETLTEWKQKQVRIQTDKSGSSSWSSWKTISGTSSTTFSGNELNYPVNAIAFRGRFSDGLNRDNSYTFRFNFKPTPDAVSIESFYISNPDGDYENITCSGPDRYSSGYYWFECSFEPIRDYASDDYVYIKINLKGAYLTEIKAGMRGADIRKGVASIVTEQTNIIINQNKITNEALTSEDSDATSSKCGIICKLKHIVNFLKVDNLINIIIPTQKQLNDLFTQFQTDLTSKLGILGLPVAIYTNIMHIIDNTEENGNWCIEWQDVEVPNFENYTIIEGGSWCFNTILQNNKINALREFSIYFTGALILLAFLQYCKNIYHRILDVPLQEDYIYFTEEDVYTLDKDTGEVTGATHKSRTTHKEVAK